MAHPIIRLVQKFPDVPGVYVMRNVQGEIVYVGKATSLRKRVLSYFQKSHDARIAQLVHEVARIEIKPTPTALEALLAEAELIKKHQPRYNVRVKDDKSYLYVVVHKAKLKMKNVKRGTREWFDRYYPAVELVRAHTFQHMGKDKRAWYFGPYTRVPYLRRALDALRRVFPFRWAGGYPDRPNLYYYKGKGGAPWLGGATPREYARDLARLRAFLLGKRADLVRAVTKEMADAAREEQFERAAALKEQLDALAHLKDIAFISDEPALAVPERIEGYDISNLGEEGMVGSMVVFIGVKPARDQYRRFHVRRKGQNDVAALAEVIMRRFQNHARDWPLPNVVVLDGGQPQLTAVKEVLQTINVDVPIVAAAKGPERRKLDLYFEGERVLDEPPIIRAIRDEAHRFAITFQRSVRVKKARESILDTIPGIGPKRKRALLRKYGSVQRLKTASLAELIAAPSVNRHTAKTVYDFFHPKR